MSLAETMGLILASATLLALPACGSVSAAPSGTSFGSSSSSGKPAPPDSAWVVNIGAGTAGTCDLTAGTQMFGDVTATAIESRATDGQVVPNQSGANAVVICAVTGSSPFSVSVTAGEAAMNTSFTGTIPSISASATEASPATGTVSFVSQSLTNGAVYESTGTPCNFYFKNTIEGVSSGKIWAAFTCPAVSGPMGTHTCAIEESFFAFETCSTM